MSSWNEKVGINVLQIDENNPRFPPTSNQDEAINMMLDRIPDKVLAIARDIAKNGLNPTATPAVLVTPDRKFIVKDGNRRISAIKLMMYPSLIKNDKDLRHKFEKLSVQINRGDFKFIDCVLFNNEPEVDYWVKLNHQDVKSGVGHEDWGAIPKMRDRFNHGYPQPILSLFEIIQKETDQHFDDETFPISTFERLVKNKEFKDMTGWKFEDNKLLLNIPSDDFVKGLVEVALDIYDCNRADYINSRSINDNASTKKYLSKKKERGFFNATGESSLNVPAPPKRKNTGVPKKEKRKSPTITLFPKELYWEIPCYRLKDICTELQQISVIQHSNAVSVLFRSFLEMSVRWYLDENNITAKNLFRDRIMTVSSDLKKKTKISEQADRAVRALCTQTDGVLDISEEFNQYGHNYELNPPAKSLVQVYNSLRSLLDGMFCQNNEIDMNTPPERNQ